MARTPRQPTVSVTVRDGDDPLRRRISDAVLAEVSAGRLRPGDPLPTTRTLARDLEVGRGAVVAAYDELTAAGFIEARPGSGTYVSAGADRAVRAGAGSHVASAPTSPSRAGTSTPPPEPAQWSLDPGRPDTLLIDTADWRRAWRHAAAAPIDDDSSVVTGHPELAQALVDHLRRTRGVVASPDEVVVVPGVSVAVRALAAAAGLAGRTVAVEDPGYVPARASLELAGATPRAVPVDRDGLLVDRLGPSDEAAYVTPAHQSPLGGRLPVDRRADLLTWARTHDGLVIEDDYDGEFRYDVPPLPALRAMDEPGEHVAYIGTASKVLTPSVRVAWVVPPRRLLAPLQEAVARERLGVDRVAGRALAHFISSGAMARHLARTGRHYAGRRRALVSSLQRHAPSLPVVGLDAGLHVVGLLPGDVDDRALCGRLAERGLVVPPLSGYALRDPRRGLVLGYARLPEHNADRAARMIATELARK